MDARRFNFTGNGVALLAVAIRRNPAPWCNTHTGIIYRDLNNQLRMVHLAWHEKLGHEVYDGSYACAIPSLDPVDEMYVAGFCELIAGAAANKRIPYNLRHDPEARFDPATGNFSSSATGTGLNCSTFVIAVFRSSGNPLIDATSWPIREGAERQEDETAQRGFVEALASRPETSTQAARIAQEVGSPRIRAEEVAGACLEDVLPATFNQCEPNGRWILQQLEAQAPPTPST